MDSDIQALKKEIAELKTLILDNNKMVLGIYRRARINMVVNIIKWTVIIGISIGAFYFVQPFVDTLINTYSSLGGLGNGANQNQSVIDLFRGL